MTHRSASLNEFEWVRLDFTDIFGGAHALHLPASRFDDVLKRGTPFDGSAMEGHARNLEADMLLVPDESTLTSTSDGLGASCAPRAPSVAPGGSAIRGWRCKGCSSASTSAATTVASELEFYLLDQGGRPIDDAGYYDGEENVGIKATRAAAAELARHGVAIDSCHAEAGPGQFELDLAAQPPLAAADALSLAKHVVQQCAASIGARASFQARPLDGAPGSGLHVHQRADTLLDGAGNLTDVGTAFVAGQLRHAHGLSALASPTVNSYKRLHSGPEAPSAAMWARLNRGALIRVSSFREGEASIEYRGADPSANPYLLFGALLATGADGVAIETQLPPPSDEDVFGGYDPAAATVRFDSLPRDLDDALDALLSDDVLLDAFDGQLVSRLIDGRRAEAAAYRSRVTEWELET